MMRGSFLVLKNIFLVLVFLLNFIATSVVDSSHIEVELHNDQSSHLSSHHDAHSKSDPEHCAEHVECHEGHYHYYLNLLPFSVVKTAYKVQEVYIAFFSKYHSPSIELTKPPLV